MTRLNHLSGSGLTLLVCLIFLLGCKPSSETSLSKTFHFEVNFTYPGTPDFIFDHLTGDISDWWDHSFTPDPYRLYIEPKPGGGFYEIFDESGNGAKHASVIYAKRGEMLRMEGPLGLSGQAITLVCTYTLESSQPEETTLTLNVNGSGQFDEGAPELVRQVWDHFLGERFGPYIRQVYEANK